ncbi:MAG: CinA family protein [Pseudomonadota bacterium]
MHLLDGLRANGLTACTAESCTGGLIAALLTDIPGSSDVFTHGYVTYANTAKTAMIGVPPALIQTHGAVSEAVAVAMAEGALAASGAGLSIAVTGIAGPGGGTADKPVGLVHLASARRGAATRHQQHHFTGDRTQVRLQAVAAALALMELQLTP